MNCKEAAAVIDAAIFEEREPDEMFLLHLSGCPSCAREYSDALKAHDLMNLLRRSEPEPLGPDDIVAGTMAAVRRKPAGTFNVPEWLPRLLAAASVALFLLFGYEQYGVVSKIERLEKTIAVTGDEGKYPEFTGPDPATLLRNTSLSIAQAEALIRLEQRLSLSSVTIFKHQ